MQMARRYDRARAHCSHWVAVNAVAPGSMCCSIMLADTTHTPQALMLPQADATLPLLLLL